MSPAKLWEICTTRYFKLQLRIRSPLTHKQYQIAIGNLSTTIGHESSATVDVTKKASIATAKAIGGVISSFVRKKELPAEGEVIQVESRPMLPSVPQESHVPQEHQSATIPCKFCHEPILATAIKCKHCGEFTDPRFAPQQQAAQPTPIIINNSNDNYVNQNHSVAVRSSSCAKLQSKSFGGGCVQTFVGLCLLILLAIMAIVCAGVVNQ